MKAPAQSQIQAQVAGSIKESTLARTQEQSITNPVSSPSSTDQTSKSTFPYEALGFAHTLNKQVMTNSISDDFGLKIADRGAAES